MITILPVNNTHIKVLSDSHHETKELKEHFTFFVENHRHIPLVRQGKWDGRISLYNSSTGLIFAGLKEKIIKWCTDTKKEFLDRTEAPRPFMTIVEGTEYFNELIAGRKEARDYQISYFVDAVNKRRMIVKSPTSSGKSLTIYLLAKFLGLRTLIVVPRGQLVEQLYKDFIDYGDDPENNQKISKDYTKTLTKNVVITTYQTASKQDKEWFDSFQCVIVDECHGVTSKSIQYILTACVNADYRVGFTGSLSGVKLNDWTVEGLLGPINQKVTTKDLMERGYIANLQIICTKILYPENLKTLSKSFSYHDEVQFLNNSSIRNQFIARLALNPKKNTLILYNNIEHGKLLFDTASKWNKDKNLGRTILFIDGSVSVKKREEIRVYMESHDDAVLFASYGTFSTGINIVNIHNVMFASPIKTKIRQLQSIGRGIRMSIDKSVCVLYDIYDDFNRDNFSKKHFRLRMKTYESENLEFDEVIFDIPNNKFIKVSKETPPSP